MTSYCLPPYPEIQINLNTVSGADAQCANNHSGLLCGVCQPGFSLSIGSSHCIRCPEDWYTLIVVLITAFL